MKRNFWQLILILLLIIILVGCQVGKKDERESASEKIGKKTDSTEQAVSSEEESKSESFADEFDGDSEQNIMELDKDIEEKSEVISADKYYSSPFNGRQINDKKLNRAVMVSVENMSAARPQSGLMEADIVYEFLVEGGITRFLPLYWQNVPDKIGPVRSLRPYLIEIARQYDALLLHAGGSPQAFALLSEGNVLHLDQIYNGNYYWRDENRKKPHNLYTGYDKFKDYLKKMTAIDYEQRFAFQQIQLLVNQEFDAENIIIDYWGNYSVLYHYLPGENLYARFLYDFNQPHLAENGSQLTAKNIIVQYVDTDVKDDAGRLTMQLKGENKALYFRDGTVAEGYWQMGNDGYTKYFDVDGEEIKLNPGQTWIQIVPLSTKVQYQKSGDENG